MHRLLNWVARFFRFIANRFERISNNYALHIDSVKRGIARYDMFASPDEAYYAQEYLHWIKPLILKDYPERTARVLDLGCGQGRLSIPISFFCKEVTAVDFTPEVINLAKQYSIKHGCNNVSFVLSDILPYIKKIDKPYADVILLIEVTFVLPSYKETLKEIFRILKPGGTLFAAFRSQYFNILHSVRNKKWEDARKVITQNEGYLWGDNTWLSWQTENGIISLLEEIGYNQVNCAGIGVCSGIKGDPLTAVVWPSLLTKDEQKELLDIEIKIAETYANCGRYILAIAKK